MGAVPAVGTQARWQQPLRSSLPWRLGGPATRCYRPSAAAPTPSADTAAAAMVAEAGAPAAAARAEDGSELLRRWHVSDAHCHPQVRHVAPHGPHTWASHASSLAPPDRAAGAWAALGRAALAFPGFSGSAGILAPSLTPAALASTTCPSTAWDFTLAAMFARKRATAPPAEAGAVTLGSLCFFPSRPPPTRTTRTTALPACGACPPVGWL
jgi:hypothetical protein